MRKYVDMTTPKGIARYPHLATPDTKFSTEGVYTVTLRLSKDAAAPLRKELGTMHQDNLDTLKESTGKEPRDNGVPLKDAVDDDGNEVVDIKFKMRPSFKSSSGEIKHRRPQLFDANVQPLKDVYVGSGSTIKVSFLASPYLAPIGAGVSLMLKAVQVLDLVQGASSSEEKAFAVEEGFTYADREPNNAPVSVSTEEKQEDGKADEATEF